MKQAGSAAISAKELKRRDFILHGNVWKVVFVIAFPLFFYSIFNYIYGIIDTIMCSGLSKDAVNAVGALSQVTNLIAAIGTGIGAGGSILVAKEIGRKDYQKAQHYASTVLLYTFIFALLNVAVVIPLARPLLSLLGISDASINVGLGYFMVSVGTASVMMLNTVFLGLEKAKGSTLNITLLNIGVVLVKVSLNALFIYGFHLEDMTYVSLSTLIANSLLLIYVICRLASKKYLFHFSFKNLELSKKTIGRITSISFPIFLGKFIFSLGKVVINGLAKDYGNDVVGALGVSNNMGGAITNPLSSIEDSTSSIISQNLGNNNPKRALKVFYVGLTYALFLAIVGVVLVTIFNDPITLFFARKAGSQEEIESYAKEISSVFYYEKMGIISLAINSAVLGLLYGFGYTKLSAAINIARVFVFRIPSFLFCQKVLKMENGFECAGISMGFSNLAIGIVALVTGILVVLRIYKRNRIKEENQTLTLEKKEEIDQYLHSYLSSFSHYKKSGVWCYEDGVVLLGAYRLYKSTHNPFYLNFCQSYFDNNIGEDGSLKGYAPNNHNLDDLESGVALYFVDQIVHKAKYEKALSNLDSQFEVQPRTTAGSFWHKEKYPNQIWLDGLYMAMPFYTLSASHHLSQARIKDILLQFSNVNKYCYDPLNGQYYHAYDESKSLQWADKVTGRSPNVWLRSVGWLAMALTDTMSYLKAKDHFLAARRLKPELLQVLNSLKPYEDPKSHMYYDLPLLGEAKGNYLETSGTLMLAYTYMRGAREKNIPYAKIKDGLEIFEGVVDQKFKASHLEGIVAVSGLDSEKRDGSVNYYLSEAVATDEAKGVGPFMMAYAEYLAASF